MNVLILGCITGFVFWKQLQILIYTILIIVLYLLGLKKGFKNMLCSYIDACNPIHNFEKLPSFPTIYVANYPKSKLEYIFPAILPGKICYIASTKSSWIFSRIVEKDEYISVDQKAKNNFEYIKTNIQKQIKISSIFVYVQDQSNVRMTLRKGIFLIAHELNIPITPITIGDMNLGKNFQVHVGKTFLINNPELARKHVRTFFLKCKKMFIKRTRSLVD